MKNFLVKVRSVRTSLIPRFSILITEVDFDKSVNLIGLDESLEFSKLDVNSIANLQI